MAMESIYNWIKVPLPPEERPPIYHSKHDPLAPLSSSTFSATRLTKPVGVIGKDLRGTVRPNEYLRAHELTMSCVDVDAAPAKFTRPLESRKPPLPLNAPSSPPARAPRQDYVETNAIEAMTTPARRPTKQEENWLAKPEYGRIPEYLTQVKQNIAQEAAKKSQTLLSSQAGSSRSYEMPQHERDELLAALRKKHSEVMHKYQLISFKKISTSNSTLGEIRLKQTLEAQLTTLEADIAKLCVPGPIMIVDDSTDAIAARAQ